jgi:DNA processing protein
MDPARTVQQGDRDWPARLSALADPPPRLRVRGDLGPPGERRVAIVGMRHPDGYGADLAREIARDLARAGVCVVSGGAEGIDGVAHAAALDAGGRTVAVLGTGIDVVYPAGHAALFARIAASGALVSEYDDGQRGATWTFPRRNRIVSGMSEAVVVVRAGERSGALITAECARRQGVPVFAVPGDVRLAESAGALALLRGGARPAAAADDVLEALGLGRQLALPVAAAPAVHGDEAALLGALGRAPRHADELARAAGLAPAAALSGLLLLELKGLCEQRPGHLFLRRG